MGPFSNIAICLVSVIVSINIYLVVDQMVQLDGRLTHLEQQLTKGNK